MKHSTFAIFLVFVLVGNLIGTIAYEIEISSLKTRISELEAEVSGLQQFVAPHSYPQIEEIKLYEVSEL